MRLKMKTMNYTKNKGVLVVAVALLCSFATMAQEVIKDSVKTVSASAAKRQKVDGVIATIGDYNILDSDIDKAFRINQPRQFDQGFE